MRLTKEHTEFTPFPQITYADMKTLNLDRVLTNLNAYLKHYGKEPVRARTKFIKVEDVIGAIEDNREIFEGFSDYRPLVKKWLEDNFLDLVHRGHVEKQNIAAPIPLSINNYKLRNAKHCRDYGASEQLYTMLMYGSPDVVKWLRDFFHSGLDPEADRFDNETNLDIESLFLIRLLDQLKEKTTLTLVLRTTNHRSV